MGGTVLLMMAAAARPTVVALTFRDLAALRAYAETGSMKLAACQLDVRPSTIRKHLARCRAFADVETTVQAVYAILLERPAA